MSEVPPAPQSPCCHHAGEEGHPRGSGAAQVTSVTQHGTASGPCVCAEGWAPRLKAPQGKPPGLHGAPLPGPWLRTGREEGVADGQGWTTRASLPPPPPRPMPEHVGGSLTQQGHGLDTDLPGAGGARGHTGVSGRPFRCAPKAPITPHAAALALGSRAAPLSMFPPWGQGQVLSHTALWLYRCAYCAGHRSQYYDHSSSEVGAVTPLYRPETPSSERLVSRPVHAAQ